MPTLDPSIMLGICLEVKPNLRGTRTGRAGKEGGRGASAGGWGEAQTDPQRGVYGKRHQRQQQKKQQKRQLHVRAHPT